MAGMADTDLDHVSPWRSIFEKVRSTAGNRRDDNGIIGSINWLRKAMEARGANPNVVRNIIYRDKGKLADKRVLFEILNELWLAFDGSPLRAPELEVLLAPGGGTDQEVLQLLGREKRRAYRSFVGGVRSGGYPKLLVTGRPGSGKTLLADYIQQALELPPRAADTIVRSEFGSPDLAYDLSRLAAALGVDSALLESRIVRIGSASAFAVQADAQAEVARVVIDGVRQLARPLVLLAHVSQPSAGQGSLGLTPLRLNTPQVPRVTAAEWLWESLLEPLSRLPEIALLVSMVDVPARALQRLGSFEGPIKLTPPTTGEARRFVKHRLPHLAATQQEDIVQRAGRSFEELRTLTLLSELRRSPTDAASDTTEASLVQLSRLLESSDLPELRRFLAALAVLSISEYPTFEAATLNRLRGLEPEHDLGSFELAFLDPVPGADGMYRCFSRQLGHALRQRAKESDRSAYRSLNQVAAEVYGQEASRDPLGDAAGRFLHHTFEARDWGTLGTWLQQHSIQQALVRRIWQAAEEELKGDASFTSVALQVAAHYVKLAGYDHADARRAFAALAHAHDPEVRAWTNLKRAEGEIMKGRFGHAEQLLADGVESDVPLQRAEVALAYAGIARWRSDLDEAARLVDEVARPLTAALDGNDSAVRLARAKVAVWSGLIHKDRGDLDGALIEFQSVATDDDLIRARLAFQRGDVRFQLGHFDHALAALDQAVRDAHRSEAPIQEQARYLSRRGALLRAMGETAKAKDDFSAARALLQGAEGDDLERSYALAKVDEEASLTLLAGGEFEEATFRLTRALFHFREYATALDVEAEYRMLRATLRLAVAYVCRALAWPYRRPFASLQLRAPDLADLRHGRERIEDVRRELEAKPNQDHHSRLLRSTHLYAALFSADAVDALEHTEAAMQASIFPFQRAETLSVIAAVLMREGDVHGAGAAIAQAREELEACTRAAGQGERGDLSLRAQLTAVSLGVSMLTKGADVAVQGLARALADPTMAPFHEGLLRSFGETAEQADVTGSAWLDHPPLTVLLGSPSDPADLLTTRLPDMLVARWRERYRQAAVR